jgi:hypothetical protein
MTKFITAAVLGVVVLVSGCASMTKPLLPENAYAGLAEKYVAYQLCGEQGNIDPALAEIGQRGVRSVIQSHTVDRALMRTHVDAMTKRPKPVPTFFCNRLAMEAAGQRETYDRNMRANAQNSADAAVWHALTPKSTSCTTNFGVTNCTSY